MPWYARYRKDNKEIVTGGHFDPAEMADDDHDVSPLIEDDMPADLHTFGGAGSVTNNYTFNTETNLPELKT